jgi:hypothetical protein
MAVKGTYRNDPLGLHGCIWHCSDTIYLIQVKFQLRNETTVFKVAILMDGQVSHTSGVVADEY